MNFEAWQRKSLQYDDNDADADNDDDNDNGDDNDDDNDGDNDDDNIDGIYSSADANACGFYVSIVYIFLVVHTTHID